MKHGYRHMRLHPSMRPWFPPFRGRILNVNCTTDRFEAIAVMVLLINGSHGLSFARARVSNIEIRQLLPLFSISSWHSHKRKWFPGDIGVHRLAALAAQPNTTRIQGRLGLESSTNHTYRGHGRLRANEILNYYMESISSATEGDVFAAICCGESTIGLRTTSNTFLRAVCFAYFINIMVALLHAWIVRFLANSRLIGQWKVRMNHQVICDLRFWKNLSRVDLQFSLIYSMAPQASLQTNVADVGFDVTLDFN